MVLKVRGPWWGRSMTQAHGKMARRESPAVSKGNSGCVGKIQENLSFWGEDFCWTWQVELLLRCLVGNMLEREGGNGIFTLPERKTEFYRNLERLHSIEWKIICAKIRASLFYPGRLSESLQVRALIVYISLRENSEEGSWRKWEIQSANYNYSPRLFYLPEYTYTKGQKGVF